jgi:hypothetical protein
MYLNPPNAQVFRFAPNDKPWFIPVLSRLSGWNAQDDNTNLCREFTERLQTALQPLNTAFPSDLTQTLSAADTPSETRPAPVVRVSVWS